MDAAANKPVVRLIATAAMDAQACAGLFEFCGRFSSRNRNRLEAQLAKDDTVFLPASPGTWWASAR